MAQPQAHSRNGAPKGATPPATRMRTGAPAMRDMTAWASPYGLMRRLSEDMDQLFTQLVATPSGRTAGTLATTPAIDWMPALETFERDGKLVVQADLPGLSADDVSIEVDEGMLTISGERREEREIDDNGTRRTERQYGRFVRAIALPDGIRTEDIQASFKDGVLEITAPLPQPSQQHRQKIQIQGGSRDSPTAPAAAGSKTKSES
jgi:HSP20 family protein